ncbi:hypothetical protein EDB89DRAFT_2230957 [Lactarius sanguifluus]|nr:hypothetical protein EDB89DRAFT_2230957 [Lactarius sanguifluus]
MSTPPPNASTQPTFHIPPVISVPTTPLGAVQTMISLLSPPATAQGAPPPHAIPASPVEISPDVPVHASALPAPPPPPAPPTHIATDPADPALASVSSHGARASYAPTRNCPRHALLPSAARAFAPTTASPKRLGILGTDVDPIREKTVALRLKPTIDSATEERDKAAQKAKWTGLALNIALGLQVLMGALTTALGAALSGKNTSVAISILGGASTFVASYLARMRGSNEPQTSLLRAKALSHFLREIHAFALDHGHEVGREWDDKVNGFRLGLENMLGNQPGSVTINTEAAGLSPGR